jgi:hypothetical protein
MTNAVASFVTGSVIQAIGVFLTFYLLSYFLRDRRAVLRSIRALSPLSEADMDRMFSRVGDTIYAIHGHRRRPGCIRRGRCHFGPVTSPEPSLEVRLNARYVAEG